MYENFLDRTPEDDARDARTRGQTRQTMSVSAGMRVGGELVPVIGPPVNHFEDVEERLQAAIRRGRQQTAQAVKLRLVERQEKAERMKRLKAAALVGKSS